MPRAGRRNRRQDKKGRKQFKKYASKKSASRASHNKSVCLHYIPLGENNKIEIYLNAKEFPSKKHHFPPSSRQGQTTINIEPAIHWAWHVLFGNDFLEEVIAKINYVWQDEQKQIKKKYLLGKIKEDENGRKYDVRLLAWQTIFGDCLDADKSIKIIKKIFAQET